ncbi:50S ribosomal protein L29 [Oscillospiraceae bacterium HV4-5-C5C]|nr:50S ribosomal protein L29 [Oscillospiraceae bacterium]MDD4367775.1 50S ribosomal protein L29 [Oscillospiraceae bacterium]NJP40843.1 50S ribosomal protein L29 [Oscillospiraceae bacterium HV4-5-C5C]
MKAKDYRDKSSEELNQEIVALKEQLFKLRFQNATKQLENTAELRLVKRDLARVNTILRERELNAANK